MGVVLAVCTGTSPFSMTILKPFLMMSEPSRRDFTAETSARILSSLSSILRNSARITGSITRRISSSVNAIVAEVSVDCDC